MPFQICLVGGDSFNGAIDPLQGRTAQQRQINVRKVYGPDQAENCHIAFINRNQESRLPAILEELQGHHVLTISDMPGFSLRGGMVEFASPSDHRIHLQINKMAIHSEGLVIGEQLIKLAEAK